LLLVSLGTVACAVAAPREAQLLLDCVGQRFKPEQQFLVPHQHCLHIRLCQVRKKEEGIKVESLSNAASISAQ
jgi:hypothetical protein